MPQTPTAAASEPDAPARRSALERRLRGLLTDADPRVRRAAHRALDALEAPDALVRLTQDLASEQLEARVEAVYGLGALALPGAREALLRALGDEDAAVRSAALRTLAERGEPETLRAVVERLRDPSGLVRREAVRALAGYRHPRVAPLVRALAPRVDATLLADVLRALGHSGGAEDRPTLEAALDHESEDVRAAAAEAIGELARHGRL